MPKSSQAQLIAYNVTCINTTQTHASQIYVLHNRKILEGTYCIPEHWSPIAKDVITRLLQVSVHSSCTMF